MPIETQQIIATETQRYGELVNTGSFRLSIKKPVVVGFDLDIVFQAEKHVYHT